MVDKQVNKRPVPRGQPAPVQALISPAGMFGLSWPVLGAAGALLVLLVLGWSIAVSRGSRLEAAEQAGQTRALRVA